MMGEKRTFLFPTEMKTIRVQIITVDLKRMADSVEMEVTVAVGVVNLESKTPKLMVQEMTI